MQDHAPAYPFGTEKRTMLEHRVDPLQSTVSACRQKSPPDTARSCTGAESTIAKPASRVALFYGVYCLSTTD